MSYLATCDQCGATTKAQYGMSFMSSWYQLRKPPTEDHHFCSIGCVSTWAAKTHAEEFAQGVTTRRSDP